MSEFTSNEVDKLNLNYDENGDENDDDVDENGEDINDTSNDKKKKKKKKKKTKKKTPCGSKVGEGRLLGGFTDYYTKYGQTDPPTKPVYDLFGGTNYPQGQIMEHGKTKDPPKNIHRNDNNEFVHYTSRISEAERKEIEKNDYYPNLLNNLRRAAECHRQVRSYAQSFIKPGIKLTDMCEKLEETNRLLVKEAGLDCGIGFPTGCSLNHVAAHYTPNPGDDTVLQYGDVMKVDFGTQVDGRIIDCAWTVAFDEKYDPLLIAVKEATEMGIKAAGVDVCMTEIGEQIQEVMESHEIELNGKVYPIKCCENLNGHSIGQYQIHAGKSVPIVKNNDYSRMEEGEIYAIETFGSTGRGRVEEEGDCSHYMRNWDAPHIPIRLPRAKKLFTHINKTFGNLAFCKRWLDRPDGGSATVNGMSGRQEHVASSLKHLCDIGVINPYPPLVDIKGCYTAQYEHTLVLRPTCKEVLSRGDDY